MFKRITPFGMMKRSSIAKVLLWWLYSIVSVLNANELCTLKWQIFCYICFATIKIIFLKDHGGCYVQNRLQTGRGRSRKTRETAVAIV